MGVEEKIATLDEKVAAKRKKLSELTVSIERKRATAKEINGEIDRLEKSIFELKAQQLFGKLKDRDVSISSVIEAVEAGIFNNNNCATNSTNSDLQEENNNETDSSRKAMK